MRVLMLKSRAGFTLVEMLIALTLTAVLGATITGAFVSQSRFFDKQDKVGAARGVARAGTSMLLSDLRMTDSDSGIVAASNTSITVRVPYAFGLTCNKDGSGLLRVSMLPVDAQVLSAAAYSGYAYRTTDSTYTYPSFPPTPNAGTDCGTTGVTVLPSAAGGRVIKIPGAPTLPLGTPLFLYQTITYSFKASASVSGRLGLFRRLEAIGTEEEIAAPFGPNAGFRFYVDHSGTSQTAVPSPLNDITGFDIVLDGLSERPNTDGTYETVSHTTSVFLKN
jgi:prepilin-type N-terminal cleavage/methylation domain-containing protein